MHTSHLHGFWEISCFFSPKPRLQFQYPSLSLCSVCVCVCFLPIHSGHQVRWTYQPVYSFILTFFGVFILYVLYSHTYSKSMDQAGKVANPARGRKMNISLFAFAPENSVSRDGFGSPVPRQPAHLHTQPEYSAYLSDSSRVPRTPCWLNDRVVCTLHTTIILIVCSSGV